MMLSPTASSGEIEGTSRPPADATVGVAGSLMGILKGKRAKRCKEKKMTMICKNTSEILGSFRGRFHLLERPSMLGAVG